MFLFLLLIFAAVSTKALDIPTPSELALILGEDEFEEYLDKWIEIEQFRRFENTRRSSKRNRERNQRFGDGCTIRVNGDLGRPEPLYLRNGSYLEPTENTGLIHLKKGEEITIACPGPGRTIRHPNLGASVSTAVAKCVSKTVVSGKGWLKGESAFKRITCSKNVFITAEITNETCFNNNTVIRVGYIVDGDCYPLYHSCFDQNRLEVLYVWYEQNPSHSVHQTGVKRPKWLDGSFYPGVNVNKLYTHVQQKDQIAKYVGKELAEKYVTKNQFLSRGHLNAKSDKIFATGQRATFFFINAAPQWQPFNGGNWNAIEQNLRLRVGKAGYHTTIYTGTFGVSQLRNETGQLVDIYLHHDVNNNPQLPVPLYYYKVVYDPRLRRGTAFVGINNPYYTEAEVRDLTFCTDRCRNNDDFAWLYSLGWDPDRIEIGYSFCCEIDDFRKTVPHLPPFQVDGLLT